MPRPVKPANAKTKPKATVDELVAKRFASLHDQVNAGYTEAAVKTCDKILKLKAGDALALRTKVQLLVSLDRYLEALAVLNAAVKEEGAPDLTLEKAYCLLKSGRLAEAEKLIAEEKGEGHAEDERAVVVLRAQLAFKQEDFAKAQELFEELLGTADPDSLEYADLETNLAACAAHLAFNDSVPSLLATQSAEGHLQPVEVLETTPTAHLVASHQLYRTSRKRKAAAPTTSTSATGEQKKKADAGDAPPSKKKKLPKNYDAAKEPDPYRWTPKRERPGFQEEIVRKREEQRGKSKNKNRAAAAQGLTQGSAGGPMAVQAPVQPAAGAGKGGKKKKGKK